MRDPPKMHGEGKDTSLCTPVQVCPLFPLKRSSRRERSQGVTASANSGCRCWLVGYTKIKGEFRLQWRDTHFKMDFKYVLGDIIH